MDTSATGSSAPESRIPFNARIQVRENGLKSRWNFGLKAESQKPLAAGGVGLAEYVGLGGGAGEGCVDAGVARALVMLVHVEQDDDFVVAALERNETRTSRARASAS